MKQLYSFRLDLSLFLLEEGFPLQEVKNRKDVRSGAKEGLPRLYALCEFNKTVEIYVKNYIAAQKKKVLC